MSSPVYYEFMGHRVATSPGSVAASTSTGVTIASTACNLATIASVSNGAYPVIGFRMHNLTTSGGNVAAYCWGGSSTTTNNYMAAGTALDSDTCKCRDPSKIWLRTVGTAVANVTVDYWLRDATKFV